MSVTPNKEITTMATIKPFRGIRPPKQYVEKIESYPYDVLSSEEARKAAEGNEMSFYHINMPEINFLSGTKFVPTNSTYWEGYPNADNPYNGPWWWWSCFKYMLPNITATQA